MVLPLNTGGLVLYVKGTVMLTWCYEVMLALKMISPEGKGANWAVVWKHVKTCNSHPVYINYAVLLRFVSKNPVCID